MINLQLNKNDLRIYIFSIIYKVLLDIIFCTWITKQYAYMGFPYSFSISLFIFTVFFILISIVEVVKLSKRGNPSDLIIIFIIYMYVFPQCSLCAFSKNDALYFIYVLVFFVLIYFLNELIRFKSFQFRGIKKINVWIWIVVILGILMIAISGYYTGFRITFNLSDYYEYRMEAREYSMPIILAYIFEWSKTIIPLGLLYSLINKKIALSIFCIFCQILCFSFNGKKSILFLLVLVFIVFFFYKDSWKKKIPLIFSILTFATIIELIIRGGSSFLATKFIRRMMFIPSLLGWAYYDYFSFHEFDYLRSTLLRRLGVFTPYTERIPRIIGKVYFSSDGSMNANTGLCGDAFSNFGWLSLLIYPLLIVLLFKFLENCLRNKDNRITVLMAFITAYMLISGAFFKCLLSGGLLIVGVLLAFSTEEKTSISQEVYDA